ncbi:UDP-glucose 4-epimerase GalE [candidate division WWE3 bacterium CG08_land_8_20_14_0_20_43_13]|uniref:UDP-glucose 4-epimerase n=1 Tax=candidate division WWE3 bacterium CG08_land_8_20_14_0_20_43_13 TaxID=1975087 RepID=A0A2H0X704_UNCKA|nr:MAG: UDP-glucose 4-epimerase GalE [candidate division WWE3 bacterium CG08_land_8_20_14_0_20_43_13]
MKILVTGGAGYIGSHAVKTLLEKGNQVIVLDNLHRGYKQAIEFLQGRYGKDRLTFYQIDLREAAAVDQIISKERPAGALHFAALCLVNESMAQPVTYFENNFSGSLNLVKAMLANKVNNLVFSSTCAVYGESQYLPMDELHPANPTNPYGESKLLVEKALRWLGQLNGLKYTVFRYFNVAGAWEDGSIGDSKKPSQLLVQNAVRGALGLEQFSLTCPKVDTPDTTPIRDYINVCDLVEAHLLALDYLFDGGSSEVFNLGTGQGNSVLEVVDEVKRLTGVDFNIGRGEARQGEYAQVYANISKADRLLGWKPRRSLGDSVSSLLAWYKSHPNGWDY